MNRYKVAAVISTYNRKKMLLEAIQAIINQSYKVSAIYIIDGPSTDGTPEKLKEMKYIDKVPPFNKIIWKTQRVHKSGITIKYIRINRDVGGAGQFYIGIKEAYAEGYDFIWIMDDDAEPYENALEELIKSYNKVAKNVKKKYEIGFLVSKSLWIDGEPNMMNVPNPVNVWDPFTKTKHLPFNEFDNIGAILVKSCSFVSLLLPRHTIKQVGFPIAEFFIWYDDAEYTSRVTDKGLLGLYIPKSKVLHKTKTNTMPNVISDAPNKHKRYFYGTRNKLYTLRKRSLLLYVLYLIYTLFIINGKILIHRKNERKRYMLSVTLGALASIFFNPKVEFPKY